MDARQVHSTLRLGRWLPALVLLVCTGCWEEIHYMPSETDTEPRQAVRQQRAETVPPQDEPPLIASADYDAQRPDDENETDDLSSDDLFGVPEEDAEVEVVDVDDTETIEQPELPPILESAESTPTPPTPQAAARQPSTRRLAWLLGSKLSLAALKNDRAGANADVTKLFDQSQALAEMLGTSVSPLPSSNGESAGQAFDRALSYLVSEGRTVGRALAGEYGDDHAALFELAVKTNALLALYRPDAPIVGTLAGAIRQASQRALLPPDLWGPLLEELDRGAPAREVHEAVFAMYANVDEYLKTTPE